MRTMTLEEIIGFAGVMALVLGIALFVSTRRISPTLKRLVYAALALRVVGAWLRYTILFEVYDGAGDALNYYERGVSFSAMLWQGDFSPFYDSSLWFNQDWTGTGFVAFPSAIILALIGPSLLGEFVVFSLLAFLGLACFALAFQRACPDVPVQRYARWIWLFPSLWFWPSSVGKEALIIMGIGISVAAFIGKRGRVQWPLLFVGIFFVFAIRPQVAAVLIFSLMAAHWLSFGRRWTPAKAFHGLVILGVGLGGIWLALNSIGVQGFDLEGVQEYMTEMEARATSGTTVDRVGIGIEGVPMAFLNILTRPWPWEAQNSMSLLSALEMVALWGIVWFRRRNVARALRNWRTHPLTRIAVPFILLYAATLGMLIVNLGIIARQRVLLFPFLFFLLEAVPARRGKPPRRAMPVRSHDLVGDPSS